MNDKYAKAIAKELRLIRIELQKVNNPAEPHAYQDEEKLDTTEDYVVSHIAGERVTI